MATLIIKDIPKTVDEFETLRGHLQATPEGAAALVILALIVYIDDKNDGKTCLTAADPSLAPARFRFIDSCLAGKEYLPWSYFCGTDPQSGYEPPKGEIRLSWSVNPHSGDPATGRVKIFIDCSGADSPRPVTLVRGTDGTWTAAEWSSLLTGIRPPVA
jgi:hypothetical protein